jgi:hypothetical protein
MTLADVENILGGPSRDEVRRTCIVDVDAQPDAQERFRRIIAAGAPRPLQWRSDQAVIAVWLDTDGRALSSECVYLCPVPVSLLDRLCNSVGL